MSRFGKRTRWCFALALLALLLALDAGRKRFFSDAEAQRTVGAGARGSIAIRSEAPTTAVRAIPFVTEANPQSEEPEFDLSGFLFEDGSGVQVIGMDIPRLDPPLHSQCLESGERQGVAPAHLDASMLAGLPKGTKGDFGPWLDDDETVDGLPRVRLSVRVRPAAAIREWDAGAGVSVETTAMRVVSIVEREILTDAWLEAWKDIYRAAQAIRKTLGAEPGLSKRAELLERAGRLSDACARARASRAGEACMRWRVLAEMSFASPCAAALKLTGLDVLLHDIPTMQALEESIELSASPGELRASLVAQWGDEVLMLATLCWIPGRGGAEGAVDVFYHTTVTMERVCALSGDDFRVIKELILEDARACPAPLFEASVRYSQTAGAGLQIEDLTDLERSRLIMERGVRVASVARGSAADRAGLLPGDVIWREECAEEGISARGFEDVLGRHARCQISEMKRIGFDVVRNAGVVRLVLSLEP